MPIFYIVYFLSKSAAYYGIARCTVKLALWDYCQPSPLENNSYPYVFYGYFSQLAAFACTEGPADQPPQAHTKHELKHKYRKSRYIAWFYVSSKSVFPEKVTYSYSEIKGKLSQNLKNRTQIQMDQANRKIMKAGITIRSMDQAAISRLPIHGQPPRDCLTCWAFFPPLLRHWSPQPYSVSIRCSGAQYSSRFQSSNSLYPSLECENNCRSCSSWLPKSGFRETVLFWKRLRK